MVLPAGVVFLIQALETAGHEAWAVGGCVRDSLLHLVPHDWDICTSATPEKTIAALPGHRIIQTGIKHGTVTVMLDGHPYEVTTFRTDGAYTDSRRPDSVNFVQHLKEDVSRRDFTINAMAYHPQRGLCDLFGGMDDLKNKLIRCVGDPQKRFEEDALRILRAMRFAATYGFAIEEKTAASLMQSRERLRAIAPERIREELLRLLTGPAAASILRDFAPVLDVFLPELAPMRNHDQFNPYHHLNIWEHTLAAVSVISPEPVLRLAMLFHDAGKPACFFRDAKGIGHFYGHPQKSLGIAREAMLRLRFDNHTRQAVEELVLHHDTPIAPKTGKVLSWLGRIGEERLRQLIAVKRADASAQHPDKREAKFRDIAALEACLHDVIEKKLPYQLKDLAITGSDLLALGIPPGPQLGKTLQSLLQRVMGGSLSNEKEALLKAAAKKPFA